MESEEGIGVGQKEGRLIVTGLMYQGVEIKADDMEPCGYAISPMLYAKLMALNARSSRKYRRNRYFRLGPHFHTNAAEHIKRDG
jgi:hypothetical protein